MIRQVMGNVSPLGPVVRFRVGSFPRRVKKIVATGFGLAAAAAAYFFVFAGRTPVPLASVVRTPVSVGTVSELVRGQGVLEPLRRVNVGSQVSGTVTALYADYNSIVRAGELLAEIDPALLQVQVEIQQTALDRQRGDLDHQFVLLEDQRHQFERVRRLHDRGLQTDQQLDAAALGVKTRDAQIRSARSQLVQAEASLQAAKLNLSYTQIRSPIDGVVIQRRVNPGQAVQASTATPTLFLLSTSLDVLKLTAGIDEADIGRVRPGMEVTFQVATYGSELFHGTVNAVRLNATSTNNVVTYPVWIDVPNDDLRLRPGMTAQVYVHVSQVEQVVRIPNDALRFRPTRAHYAALRAQPPADEPARAIDHIGDRIVDPGALRAVPIDEDATTVDALFAPPPKADARATVWTWDDAGHRFVSIQVRVGVTDGQMTELLSGDVQVGEELVTGVILPITTGAKPPANPLLGNRGRIR
jgi:HlyD family secretion protein